MAARRERIEPSFERDEGVSEAGLSISPDDRAVPTAANDRKKRKPAAKSTSGKATAKSGGGSGRGGARRGGGSGDGGGNGRRRRRSFLGHVVRLGIAGTLWGGLAVAAVVGYFAVKLPQEAWEIPARPPNVKIVSVNGELLANRGLTGGKEVSLDEMSPYIPEAVIAIEDRRFYDHFGVDPLGIVRAFVENWQAGSTVQGGSTLTQQLAKNIFLNPEQTIQRKIQEAILSVWLEHKFTKDQILDMYLNRVYFGSGATGVEAAARRYFGKSASEVTLSEAATLAGLLKAPSRLSPARDPKAAKERSEVVLSAMLDEGKINRQEYDDAVAEKPVKAKSYWDGAQHYAADLVMRDIKKLIGDVKQDVIVETTIEMPLERIAEKTIRQTIDSSKQNVTQGALVAIDGTGAIRALVGGRDYAESQFNRAVDAKRQPGSTFKPFVYETALEHGWRPESIIVDGPVQIGKWKPSNYENTYRGPVMVADALRFSLNTVAAKLIDNVGTQAVIDTAHRLGIKSDIVDNPSIALGTSEVSLLELTGAFAPFANGGYEATPHLVNRITTEDGKVVWERGAEVPPKVLSEDMVGMMNAMLRRVVNSGTGRKAAIEGFDAAGKTGTTQDFKDAWFMGYTAELVTGVWFGNDNGAKMKRVTGGSLPAAAWHEFMSAALDGTPNVPLPGNYTIGEPDAPLMADGNGGEYYDGELPRDDGVPIDGSDGGQNRVIYDRAPPPGVVVQERVSPRRENNGSLFRRIFGG
ncbi:transglycosylase domain-containing protein [Jiella pacifica]|uniref:PBP1A family penicillin-binding protein n=1 Tax=Jiella pacifica TaxID=2696469 RepID=A0A6N9T204_9HYPH|nr:transglycosylase domain-containing protein [Jiella pacifica]NDW05211.1 PBP1A family penicillin-binding protein [Jiella pacifica]